MGNVQLRTQRAFGERIALTRVVIVRRLGIAVYRPQAEVSDGTNDGKIETARRKNLVLQMLIRAGDN